VGPHGADAPFDGGLARLTLDGRLQRGAERLLDHARPLSGAAALLHVPSGRLLVWAEVGADGGHSVITRPAPSASVFKIVTSAALLETGRVTPQSEVCVAGGMRQIERRHLEAPRSGKIACGPFGLALGHSRNAVYAQLVTRHLLRDDLARMAQNFGFNDYVPFDVPVRVGTLELPYGDLELARTAAGFENVSLSPLGGAYLAYQVASAGQRRSLHIVEQAGEYQRPAHPRRLGQTMRPFTAYQLMRMMEVTVHGGTSMEAFTDEHGMSVLKDIRVAGKTGTLKPSPSAPTTSWFVGFAPSRRPEVVVSVVLNNRSVWRSKANELARDLLLGYFAGRRGIEDPLALLAAR